MTKARPVIQAQGIKITTGQNPRTDDGGPRPWQTECMREISGWRRAAISGPTGSGKSLVAKWRGAILLEEDPKAKHIVAIPQNCIADSFGPLRIKTFRGGKELHWCAGMKLTDGIQSIGQLERFLQNRPENTPEGRTAVCTHQALVAVFQRLKKTSKLDCFRNVLLTIDEAHHSMAVDAEDAGLDNRIGEVVRYFFDADLRLDMFSATWTRANQLSIIPAGCVDGRDYTRWAMPIDKHLATMQHLKEIEIRFMVGPISKCLSQLFGEHAVPTLVYLPAVNSSITSAHGTKYDVLQICKCALGKPVKHSTWQGHHRSGDRIATSVDLVTELDRSNRLCQLRDSIWRKSCEPPDVVWALNMCKEGFDWPAAARAIVIGLRGSMVDTLQMLGRLMRDHSEKPRVEFDIVMPVDEEDPESIRQYIKALLVFMIVEWQFKQPSSHISHNERQSLKRAMVDDPSVGQRAVEAAVDAAIGCDDEHDAVQAISQQLNRHSIGGASDRPTLASGIAKLMAEKSRLLLGSDSVPFEPTLAKHVFGCVHAYTVRFGYATLSELRMALGEKQILTEETILSDADKFFKLNGRWPSKNSGNVPGKSHESWVGYDSALYVGNRGLPGGGSLAQLLARERGVKNHKQMPALTEETILSDADKFFKLNGRWPSKNSGNVPGKPHESWAGYDSALYVGNRGLPGGGITLVQLLARERGVKNLKGMPALTEETILSDADKFFKLNGRWPSRNSGNVPGKPHESWAGYNAALRKGSRGLPGGGITLVQLLDKATGSK